MNIVIYAGDNKYYKTLLPIASEIKKSNHNFLFLYSEETQLKFPQQKEYFSAYVFEDVAKKILDENPELKQTFEAKKKSDTTFAEDGAAQLDWIYKQTPYYEKAHLQYPVYRVN